MCSRRKTKYKQRFVKGSCQSKQCNYQDTNEMGRNVQKPFSKFFFHFKNVHKINKNLTAHCNISLKCTTKELFFCVEDILKR